MRKRVKVLVVSFETTTQAMNMEKVCDECAFVGRIIPLPEAVSAGCGLAYKCSLEDRDKLMKIIDSNHIIYDKISEVEMWELS